MRRDAVKKYRLEWPAGGIGGKLGGLGRKLLAVAGKHDAAAAQDGELGADVLDRPRM